jgi:hypothetical protein
MTTADQYPSGLPGRTEEIVTGRIVDVGADHLTIHDLSVGEDIFVRIDDVTQFRWADERLHGRLTDNAQVRVGFFIAGGLHKATDVLVLDPGDGSPLGGRASPLH